LTTQAGGGSVDTNSLWDVTLSPHPDKEGKYLVNIKNLGLVFNSIHYSDAVTPINNINGVTWSGDFDVVWAQLHWGEEGFGISVECGSNPDAYFGTGEVEFELAEENWPPPQTHARLVLATITPGEAGPPGQPPSPPVVKKLINSNLRATTSFAFDQTNGAYFEAVVIAAHASVNPTERFRWAAGNNVKGWDYLLGKGYSSFSQYSVDNVRAMEIAVGDPTKPDASGFTLIVGDANTGTDLFQLYSGEGSEQKKIFGKWTEKLEFGLNLQDATGKLLINDSGDPELSLTRLDYDIGIVANTMGYANQDSGKKAPILTLFSNTDYIYLSLYGSNSRAQFRIEDREVDNPSKIEIDKWSIYGQGPKGQIMFWSWQDDLEYKLEWNGNFIKMQVEENGYNPKLTLYRTEDQVGIILDPSGKYEPSATEAPIVALFSNTDYVYSTIYGSQGQGQVGVRDNSDLFKIEIDKWSIYGFGSEKENVFWAGWEDDIELTLRRDTAYIKCLIDSDGNPNLDLRRDDYLCGISLMLMGNIPNPEDRDAPLLTMFSNTAEIYASICGSNSQAQICVKDPGTIGYSLELEKWSIRGKFGGSTQKEIWMQWGQDLGIKLTDGGTDSSMLVHADYIQRKVGEVTSYALFTPDGAGTGDILYYNADTEQWQNAGITPSEGDMLMFYNNAWVRLEAGEDGKVLTMLNGLPHWTDNEGGGGLPEGGIPGDVLRMGANGPYWENTSICY
jgi:hypothetical protein